MGGRKYPNDFYLDENSVVSEGELFSISGSQEWDEYTVASAIRRYILALSENVVTR